MVRTQLSIIILYIVHTTTCFGLAHWPSSGCTTNLISGYTTMRGYCGGTRSRVTAVGGMFMSLFFKAYTTGMTDLKVCNIGNPVLDLI